MTDAQSGLAAANDYYLKSRPLVPSRARDVLNLLLLANDARPLRCRHELRYEEPLPGVLSRGGGNLREFVEIPERAGVSVTMDVRYEAGSFRVDPYDVACATVTCRLR